MQNNKVTINKGYYIKLKKLAEYAQYWYPYYEECKNCGTIHPEEYVCNSCGYDNSTGEFINKKSEQ